MDGSVSRTKCLYGSWLATSTMPWARHRPTPRLRAFGTTYSRLISPMPSESLRIPTHPMRMPFSSASKNALDGGAYCCSKCCCSKSNSETRDRDLTRMRTVRPAAGPVARRQRRWLRISALSYLRARGAARCKLLDRASLTSIRPTFAMHGLTESVNYRAGRRCLSLSKSLYTVFASSFATLNTAPYHEHRLTGGLSYEKTTTSHRGIHPWHGCLVDSRPGTCSANVR